MPKMPYWENSKDWQVNDECNDFENSITMFGKEEVDLINTMRSLWEQHVAWTRMTIISMAADLPDVEFVSKRLLRNPSDMANVLKPFYGNKKAMQFKCLMEHHLTIAAQLITAAKAGNKKAAAKAKEMWYENADDIAAFLSSVNPYRIEDDFKNMLYEHLSLTEKEALARLAGNYPKDIALYDEIENQALAMADEFSAGIIKQFSDAFEE